MSLYFKIIGLICLIGFACGIIPMFLFIIPLISAVISVGNGLLAFLYILSLISYLAFGPALGLGFIYLGELVERH